MHQYYSSKINIPFTRLSSHLTAPGFNPLTAGAAYIRVLIFY